VPAIIARSYRRVNQAIKKLQTVASPSTALENKGFSHCRLLSAGRPDTSSFTAKAPSIRSANPLPTQQPYPAPHAPASIREARPATRHAPPPSGSTCVTFGRSGWPHCTVTPGAPAVSTLPSTWSGPWLTGLRPRPSAPALADSTTLGARTVHSSIPPASAPHRTAAPTLALLAERAGTDRYLGRESSFRREPRMRPKLTLPLLC